MLMNANNFQPKSSLKFCCILCDFKCSKICNWKEHLLTIKHNANEKLINANKNNLNPAETIFSCECGKKFKHKPSLSRHKKKCSTINNSTYKENNAETIQETNIISPELILNIIHQNQEFKDLLIEQNKTIIELSKNCGTTNINNSMNNSNNKTFNLQLFLNETCKNAMNIMDFVDSIKIQLSDIESIGELGFVNGMSKLIIKHLNALDENMRPVHCSDPKRETLYVKDQNVWEKEDPDNKKIKKAIKYISHKNICALPEWKAKYPDCIYSDSNRSDQYNHIVIEAMGGSGDNDVEKADKIIKKIAKVVTIDKKI